MSQYDLNDLGWSSFYDSSFTSLCDTPDPDGLAPARVARAEREQYVLMHEDGTSHAVPAGRLRREDLGVGGLPVVGDWVAARFNLNLVDDAASHAPAESTINAARIEAILPRRTLLARFNPRARAMQALAANVDLVFLAAGLDHDFNPRRLERGAALAREAGAEPVVVLTKADLRPDHDEELAQAAACAPGVRALAISSDTGRGLGELRSLLTPGVTAVLLGSSGAGKSTLVNALLGYERQRTGQVRAADSRGRHVTTHRELFLLPGGGLLMDTPGLRAFGLTGGDGVDDLFADVERLAATCRFRDCRHETESGCGVKNALESGELTPERYASYLKLRSEAEQIERRRALVPDLEAKRRGKKMAKLQRRFSRNNPKKSGQ